MSTTMQTESLKLNLEDEIRQTESPDGRHDSEKTQTATVIDDYDKRVSLLQKAFSEISKLCFWTDYQLDSDDWALLDAARLDPLDYTELRAALRYAYLQIKRKAQVKHSNHSRF